MDLHDEESWTVYLTNENQDGGVAAILDSWIGATATFGKSGDVYQLS